MECGRDDTSGRSGSSDLAAERLPLVYSAFPREKEECARPMPGVSTDTITFLFTDVEGCIARWERSAEAAEVALTRYEEILKEILEAHRGYLSKTVGKAFCCAFAAVTKALEVAFPQEQAEGPCRTPAGSRRCGKRE